MASEELPGDALHVSVPLKADVATSFRLFTEETDTWWKRGPRFRLAGSNHGTLHLEPFLHGRLFESFDRAGVTRVVRIGRVHVWEPPTRVAFEWRPIGCAPNEITQVEVTFAANGSDTDLTVKNTGWSALPAHRDLKALEAFWTELMRSLSELAPAQGV
jgi:uncharacterized protein YndB with AHSA1/START domain